MNDIELDELLNAWEAPPVPRSLREGLRARFRRRAPRSFAAPLRWGLATALAMTVLVIGLQQIRADVEDMPAVGLVSRLYHNVVLTFQIWQVRSVITQIRNSNPKVYVDGQLAGPLRYGHAATMEEDVPGAGVYVITPFRGLKGWAIAGEIHGNAIEFQVEGKQVRIECQSPLPNTGLSIRRAAR